MPYQICLIQITVQTSRDSTATEFKTELYRQILGDTRPLESITLVYRGCQFEGHRTLAERTVLHEDTFHLRYRMRGGGLIFSRVDGDPLITAYTETVRCFY